MRAKDQFDHFTGGAVATADTGDVVRGFFQFCDGVCGRDCEPGVFKEREIGKIVAPTLVIVGDEDVATVPAKAERIRDLIPGAKLAVIPHAGHSSTIEEPDAVNAAIASFLAGVAQPLSS